jgi:hypothetical protein
MATATATDWTLAAPKSLAEAVEFAESFRAWWVAANGEDTTDQCPYIAQDLMCEFRGSDAVCEVWAGSYDCNRDQYHIVCRLNDYLIDISADQFGGPEVAVADVNDLDYEYRTFRPAPNAI